MIPVAATFAHGQEQKDKDKPRYFMCVFAHETRPRGPRTSHTFATFVKLEGAKVDAQTISWLPKTGDIRVLRRFAEPGVNLDLKDSLDFAASIEAQVFEWGPFEIKPELYDRALKQIDRLNSGRIQYKAVDSGLRGEMASNCFHAVADIDTSRGFRSFGLTYGVDATAQVVDHLTPWVIDPGKTYPFVNDKLGLGKGIIMQSGSR